MLKLYTDTNYLTAANRKIVFPLLFDLWYLPNANLCAKYQIVADIDDCDIAVVPVDIAHFGLKNKNQDLIFFIDRASALNKKVWLYSAGDYGSSLQTMAYTFRMGGFDSKLNSRTFIMPSFIVDPYDTSSRKFDPLPKMQLPQIGFVGHASNSKLKKIKEFLLFIKYNYRRLNGSLSTDFQSFYPSSNLRFKYLTLLLNSPKVNANFIFRNKYRAGAKTEEEKEQTATEFFQNIAQNPYTFCLRGQGNFSVRFYETLAMGRIPFVVESDFRLPLQENIDWKKHCVLATETEMVKTLSDFHNNISASDFELMQINNRKLWLTVLEREAYFCAIYSIFNSKIA
ncbi:hypothetical protein [Flavobacterium sp. TAB 87]|uniref:hypothetical protein n=1 Tax=Flavobacterium sp. TAB 87 TaxID=1729581 RepID=UPI00076CCC24|nr:hypothetical protein [Flavobacterium sp. TAB 87]KVV15890.1 Exostosin family protein [Flavobacterium sp. TAB 87]